MEKYLGEIASRGIAQCKLQWYQKKQIAVSHKKSVNVECEIQKYKDAFTTLENELGELQNKAEQTLDEKTADIFSAFSVLLQDEVFQKEIEKKIEIEKLHAEYAIQMVCQDFADRFFALDDIYMRERGNDILHVSYRLLSVMNDEQKTPQLKDSVILIAKDLSPSELLQLNQEKLQGIILLEGSIYSHTTVIAQMMNIPMLVNVNGMIGENLQNDYGIINAEQGYFYVNPDAKIVEEINKMIENQTKKNKDLEKFIGKKTCTLDGKNIKLYANISCFSDLQLAISSDAEGIGLLRSEGLFMQQTSLPSEETQFEFYKQVVLQMKGKNVIIRTLDIGSDKNISYLPLEEEKNPAIGLRGIRFTLLHPEIMKMQLRAILRAAVYGTVSILYPMVTTYEEVKDALRIMKEVKDEFAKEHIPFGEVMQGIMIETPAAALCSAALAKEVDFFSLGTNDLTQHTLAMDRQNLQLSNAFNAKNPAVIKLIELSIINAHQAGIPIGICGELAGDLSFIKELITMGIDSLSVVPSKTLEVRKAIRNLDLSN